MKQIVNWLFILARDYWFALVIGACLIFFELIVFSVPILATPDGFRWLGAGIFNTGDMPVYFNYLSQANHSWLITNLYNNLPQISRFDLFWSVGGLFVKLGLSPILSHEILRWIATLILGLAIYATAKAVTANEKQARLASFLIIGGLSSGWIYDVWMGATNQWTPLSPAIADMASELAIAPTLLGGAHIILSLALQLLAIRWIWEAITNKYKKSLIFACFALLTVTSFHPYFIPLFGLVSLIALIRIKKDGWKKSLLYAAVINLSLIPAAVYYLYIFFNDSGFRIHQLQVNILPLDPWYFWVLILIPFIPAFFWMAKRFTVSWPLAWIAAAIICMMLPFPWTRKFTQGLLPALVVLTLPFWLMLVDKISANKIIWPLKICFLLPLAFPYIHLFQTQIFMVTDPGWSNKFYAPIGLFEAWNNSKASPRDEMILATDLWSNYWTPAYTTKHVWIGHNHETPDFKSRVTPYLTWTTTTSTANFNVYLETIPVTKIIAIQPNQVERVADMIDKNLWMPILENSDAAVWQRK
jgi:hypothetical protein